MVFLGEVIVSFVSRVFYFGFVFGGYGCCYRWCGDYLVRMREKVVGVFGS